MINFEGVINPLSFGYITYGLTKELFKRKQEFNFSPISNNLDFSCFSNIDESYKNYIQTSFANFLKSYSSHDKSFKLWHINGSHQKIGKKANYLLTFHECDQLTNEEVNILNSYDKIFVTSTFSQHVFQDCGVKSPVVFVPMGLDSDTFYNLNKPRPFKDIIVFSIFGKAEHRKSHFQTIPAWIKKYGNDHRYKLHLYITNPFFKPEQMNQIYAQLFDNRPKPFNVDIFPYLPTNAHLNEAYNSTDIVIDMSGGESISLGSLNCLAIGKHGIIHHNSGMKDWSNEENAIIIKPNGKKPCYDGVFFHPNQPFNQGNFYTFSTDDFINGCDLAISRFNNNPINIKGMELNNNYSFKNAIDIISKEMDLV